MFEGLFNDKIRFTPEEWKTLVENELDGITPEGQMMRCLARFPDFTRRGQRLRRGDSEDPDLLDEVQTEYLKMKTVVQDLNIKIPDAAEVAANPSPVWSLQAPLFLHFLYSRGYGLALTISIIFNRMLDALGFEDHRLDSESTSFAQEIVTLAEQSHRYRPLGSSYIILCLIAASGGTNDEETILSAKAAIDDYKNDFPWRDEICATVKWDWVSQNLRLAN